MIYNGPMEHNTKAIVRYDGTNFSGWQVQPNGRTVQGDIEAALSTIAQRDVRIHGAGRTDAGVHALGQVFHFTWDDRQPLDALQRSLARMLQPEILIESITVAAPDFHATYSAVRKHYAYVFHQALYLDPLGQRYAWTISPEIDRDTLHALAQRFVGRHDFAGMACSGTSVKTTERTLHSIDLHPGPIIGPQNDPAYFHLIFDGEGFLYKMVRNIVGTLYDTARGHLPDSGIDTALTSPGPYKGYTAPAQALFLHDITY